MKRTFLENAWCIGRALPQRNARVSPVTRKSPKRAIFREQVLVPFPSDTLKCKLKELSSRYRWPAVHTSPVNFRQGPFPQHSLQYRLLANFNDSFIRIDLQRMTLTRRATERILFRLVVRLLLIPLFHFYTRRRKILTWLRSESGGPGHRQMIEARDLG